MGLLNAICNQPWLITEEWLQTIVEIAERENEPPQVISARLGRPLNNAPAAVRRDNGVSIIPVVGPMFRHANMLTEISGATTTARVAQDVGAALDDPAVRAIVLAVDSPGGEATGIADLAELVRGASKPTAAHVEGQGASGAYWLASACQEVVASPTAFLGSIGVVLGVRPQPQGGRVQVVSSGAPLKRQELLSAAGMTALQEKADAIEKVFVDAVAAHRRTTPAKVLDTFGRGGTLVAARALEAGMADRIGTLESLVADLGSRPPARAPVTSSFPAGTHGAAVMAENPNPNPPQPPAPAPAPPQPAPPQPPPPAPPMDVANHPQVLALRQQVEALERREAEAMARTTLAEAREFFSRPDLQARVVPAEAAGLVPIYCQLAHDDRVSPAQVQYAVGTEVRTGTRLQALQQSLAARPPHNLFVERTIAQVQATFPGAAALPSGGEAEASLESLDKSTREWAARMNKNGNKAKAGA
jgi:ClpP class serine protease